MSKPIVVYLDSSDYSVLSDSRHANDGSLVRVREFLTDAKSSGIIEIRFSMVHVVEAFHRNPGSRNHAIARAQLITELSGRQVLRYFGEIVRRESSTSAGRSEVAYDDRGLWHPDYPGLGNEIQSAISSGIQRAIETVPSNRKERRIAKKHYGGEKARRNLVSDPYLIRKLAERHGMSTRFIENELFPMIVKAEHDPARTESAILGELFDPVTLVSHYLDRLDKGDKLRHSILSLGEKLLVARANVQRAIEDLRATPNFRDVAVALASTWKSGALLRRQCMRDKLYLAATGNEPTAAQIRHSSAQFRGLDTLVNAIDGWMWDVAQPISPRKPRPSDSGDLLHLFYLPYVDLWRGDPYSAGLANRVRSSSDAVPVSSIFDIEPTVNRLLSQK